MKIEVPKSMQTFAIGSFALHPDQGLTIASQDVLVYVQTASYCCTVYHRLIVTT